MATLNLTNEQLTRLMELIGKGLALERLPEIATDGQGSRWIAEPGYAPYAVEMEDGTLILRPHLGELAEMIQFRAECYGTGCCSTDSNDQWNDEEDGEAGVWQRIFEGAECVACGRLEVTA